MMTPIKLVIFKTTANDRTSNFTDKSRYSCEYFSVNLFQNSNACLYSPLLMFLIKSIVKIFFDGKCFFVIFKGTNLRRYNFRQNI